MSEVYGTGVLADAIGASVLTGQITVAVTDAWDMRTYPKLRERGLPWLPVRTELGRVVIGPVELPGEPGCVECAELRRRLARPRPGDHDALWARHGATLAQRPSSWLTELSAGLVADLVADELARLAEDAASARTRNGMLHVDLLTLAVTHHRFLPDPLCPSCGDLPEDTAELARITLRPLPKPAPTAYRVRSIVSEVDTLASVYVGAQAGLIRSESTMTSGGLAIGGAIVGMRGGDIEVGWGRTRGYRTSRLTAMLEALERYGGTSPKGKRTTVRASLREVAGHAIDPRTLGLYPADRYRLPDFRYQPFDENRPHNWVWAYSFARREPVLVPEAVGYYRAPERFVYEISNGCALGGCLEEAILHGALEVLERDAFLMTWYARLPMPRIDLSSTRDRTIPLIAEALNTETGYEVLAFDTTLEHGVPCVWTLAVDPTDDPNRPKAVCAAGAHPDPERAVESALSELGPILVDLIERYPGLREHAASMVADPSLVRTMGDHSTLYGHRDAFARLDFLTTSRTARAAGPPVLRNDTLGEDLLELCDRLLRNGMDIIVVDQTAPEHRAGDLCCVKVLIPGTLSMTFGHDYRRVHDLPRLREVPVRLGYHDRPLGTDEINPHPHPFP